MNTLKINKIENGGFSTLIGMNGGNIESPDGKLLVYAKKKDLSAAETEIWICSRDLSAHRFICAVSCMNHNGPSASFVDNSTIVFRDMTDGIASFTLYDVEKNMVKYRIYGKMGHRAEKNLFPFSVREDHLGKNSIAVKKCGIYILNTSTGEIRFLLSDDEINEIALSRGLRIKPNTCDVSHLQLSPDTTSVMMRMGVEDCPIFGALACVDIASKATHLIPDKPVHQLWYDNDTYMATRQFAAEGRIDMSTSYIARFSKDGEEIETLGGIGNHIDGSPDRTMFAGDRCYPGYSPDIYVYEKGSKKPMITICMQDLQDVIWKKQVHPNPSFSGDGKRLYFNMPVSNDKTEASFIEL